MSTNAVIAIKVGKEIRAVYCHWDGYTEYLGAVLETFYDRKQTIALMKQGDMSSIGASIGVKHDFDARNEYIDCPATQSGTVAPQCTFYHRDRDDELTTRVFPSLEEMINHYGVEYYYCLTGNTWRVLDTSSGIIPKWIPLIEALAVEKVQDKSCAY